MKKTLKTALLITLTVLIVLAGLAVYKQIGSSMMYRPEEALETMISGELRASGAIYSLRDELYLASAAENVEARELYEILSGHTNIEVINCERERREARAVIRISCPTLDAFCEGLQTLMNESLEAAVEKAERSEDFLTPEREYKSEQLEASFGEAWGYKLEIIEQSTATREFEIHMSYADRAWTAVLPTLARGDLDALREELFLSCSENAAEYRKHYTIEEGATVAPAPNQAFFGETYDPHELAALLETPLARELIAERTLVWNEDIEFIPETLIRYYLDETTLAIQWQEVEARAVGTFAEIIVKDGSQLRRKLAGDQFGGMKFDLASNLAQQANAVFACGGDMYNHGRNCGIVVYNRELYRFEPHTCDVCYIDTKGNMIFSYRWQFPEWSDAEYFIRENDILFSISFGPVLIADGKDVTPYQYSWGEIHDEYARAALGQLGELHYLTMNINCKHPYWYYLATLRQATDAMMRRGCINAYALDGGQTAVTIVNGKLINPVQFGWEKPTSDIIYFATALPSE